TYSDISYLPNNKEISVYVPNNSNSISVKKVWVDSDNKETTNHPSSIKLNLIQNIQTPTGVTVNTYIYIKNEWEVNESVIDNQSLVVKEGGSIKMTLPVSCVPGSEASQVSVTGATSYSFSNDNQYYGHIVLTINNVTQNMNLKIKLAGKDNSQVKYDYDKEYKTDKKVIDTVTLNDLNDWSHTWTNVDLPKQVDGKDCIYTIEEEVPSGYQVSYNNNGILEGDITVTNKKLDSTELPNTGGFGKLGYYAIGALFITTTLLIYIVNLKKKEDSIT
ncbi:Cna B-type domain-containing protein, partial [Catenibacterium sp.]